jgi:hypothetical protein
VNILREIHMTERYYDRLEKKWKTCTLVRKHPDRPDINPDITNPFVKALAWSIVFPMAIVFNLLNAMLDPFLRDYVPGGIKGSGDDAGYT